MGKRIAALAAALCLLLSPALAAEPLPFLDLDPHRSPDARPWYDYDSIRVCVDTGLMVGSEGYFHPARPITVAEVITLCARIHSAHTGDPIPQGETWYDGPTALLKRLAEEDLAPLAAPPTAPATRADFAALLGLAWQDESASVNRIEFIPDTSDPTVLRLYNAGILTGTDELGSFTGWRGLTRAEAAAMAARVVEPSLRKRIAFTPIEIPGAEATPEEPAPRPPAPQEPQDHDHGSRSDALEQLAAYLAAHGGLDTAEERDAFCIQFGISPHTPLLSLPYDGSLTACELLPFFVAVTDVRLTGAVERRGLTEEEFWRSSFQGGLSAGDYLKGFLQDGLCESLLVLRGDSREELDSLRAAMVPSQVFSDLDPRGLYQFAVKCYPQTLGR